MRAIMCAIALCLVAPATGQIGTIEFEMHNASRDRTLAYLAYVPQPVVQESPLILISHGGTGSNSGHLRLTHLGTAFAEAGYVAIHIGHRASAPGSRQTADRPADVSFTLDRFDVGAVPLPQDAIAAIDLSRVGHIGHSFGAYTAHAIAGAIYDHGSYLDDRIDAVAPISPQGADQFGAFDFKTLENTWRPINVPTYDLIGELELSSNVVGTINEPGWRLTPFSRYTGTSDRFLSIVPGADHADMGNEGSPDVQSYITSNAIAFFDVYLRDQRERRAEIGRISSTPLTVVRKRSADANNDGVATPADLNSWIVAFNTGNLIADVNADGTLTPADFTAWVIAYNQRTSTES